MSRWGIHRLFRLATRRPDPTDAVQSELEHHLALRAETLVDEGWSPADARREAVRRFGNLRQVQRACEALTREQGKLMRRRDRWESLVQDVAYAVRGIRRYPMFALAIVATLGLGIGANAAIFAVVDAVLVRPLPYHDPDRLIQVSTKRPNSEYSFPFLWADHAKAWAREQTIFDAMSLYQRIAPVRTDGDEPEAVSVEAVSVNLLSTLGLTVRMGRGFTAADAIPGAETVAILRHPYWRDRMGADPDVVGTTIRLDDTPVRVIGVLPSGIKFPRVGHSDMWIPIATDFRVRGDSLDRYAVIARLPMGMDSSQAQQRADALTGALRQSVDPDAPDLRLSRYSGFRANTDMRQALWLVSGAVIVMLLIALVNGINLFLVRGTARMREFAVRLAVGASRRRLFRQIATESVVLALAGGGVAIGIASLGITALLRIAPSELTVFSAIPITIDQRVWLYTFMVSVVTGLLLGLVPAFRLLTRRTTTAAPLVDMQAASTRAGHRFRLTLVAAEVALSVLLLVAAGLVIKSFVRLVNTETGIDAANLAVLSLALPEREYPTRDGQHTFYTTLRDRLAQLSGVRTVTLATGLPPDVGFTFDVALEAEGLPAPGEQPFWVPQVNVDSAFFETLGIPLVAGRNFSGRADSAVSEAIVDPDLVRFLWGQEDPIGRRFRFRASGRWYTVAGVAGDVKLMGQDDRNGALEVYFPLRSGASYMSLGIRTEQDPELMAAAIRNVVHTLDPKLPIAELRTARAAFAESVDKPRFFLVLMGTFAAVSVLLAAIGLYAVLSFVVTQRVRELGIRVALGARAPDLVALVMRQGVAVASLGVAVGVAGALASSGVVRSLLFGVTPTDPSTFLVVALAMLAAAALACFLPARRATRVDPMTVLKID